MLKNGNRFNYYGYFIQYKIKIGYRRNALSRICPKLLRKNNSFKTLPCLALELKIRNVCGICNWFATRVRAEVETKDYFAGRKVKVNPDTDTDDRKTRKHILL